MEKTQEQPITDPKEMSPEALHAWIVDELGDSELASKVNAHPELTEQYVRGEGYPTANFFDMTRAIAKEDPELTKDLLDLAVHNDRLMPLTYSRVVGSSSDEMKENFVLRERFELTEKSLESNLNERDKTMEELVAIEYACRKIDEIRIKYGLPAVILSPSQVVLHKKFLTENKVGSVELRKQEALIADEGMEASDIYATVFHELVHLKGYGAMQVDTVPGGKINVETYRVGLKVISRFQKKESIEKRNVDQPDAPQKKSEKAMSYLRNLNEAVTEEISTRMLAGVPSGEPLIGKTLRAHRLKVYEYIRENSESIKKDRIRAHWITGFDTTGKALGSFGEERILMFDLFHKIVERNPEMFEGLSEEESEEELFEMLQKAMFTGNILPFGKLFNDTFGKGKFREYGHLQTLEEQEEFVRNL